MAEMIFAWTEFAYYNGDPIIPTIVGFHSKDAESADSLKWLRLFIALRDNPRHEPHALQGKRTHLQKLMILSTPGKLAVTMMKCQLQMVMKACRPHHPSDCPWAGSTMRTQAGASCTSKAEPS